MQPPCFLHNDLHTSSHTSFDQSILYVHALNIYLNRRGAGAMALYISAHNNMGASSHSDPSHIKHHAGLKMMPIYFLRAESIQVHGCQYSFTHLALA